MGKLNFAAERKNHSQQNVQVLEEYDSYFSRSEGQNILKLENFPKYTTKETISRFIARNNIFMQQLSVCGSVVELGVQRGGSIMTWAQLSSIYEPTNHTRLIVGFDTFEGFPSVTDKDVLDGVNDDVMKKGGLAAEVSMKEDIEEAVRIWDINRSLNHIPKVKLIQGDIMKTLPEYIQNNPYLVVSLLHLDADLYEPTKLALELLLPRMPKGAILLFDELNMGSYPGETLALLDSAGVNNFELKRFAYSSNLSYAVLK